MFSDFTWVSLDWTNLSDGTNVFVHDMPASLAKFSSLKWTFIKDVNDFEIYCYYTNLWLII